MFIERYASNRRYYTVSVLVVEVQNRQRYVIIWSRHASAGLEKTYYILVSAFLTTFRIVVVSQANFSDASSTAEIKFLRFFRSTGSEDKTKQKNSAIYAVHTVIVLRTCSVQMGAHFSSERRLLAPLAKLSTVTDNLQNAVATES